MNQRLVNFLHYLIKVAWKVPVKFGWKYRLVHNSPMGIGHDTVCVVGCR